MEHRQAINPNSYFIPNGVDFELFKRALDADLRCRRDHPPASSIIGFAGWMGFHIDVALAAGVAEAFPDYSLVLVGPDRLPDSSEYQRLRSLPNVHFPGAEGNERAAQLPEGFNVALMPGCSAGNILSAYPLKLHEYLAAGGRLLPPHCQSYCPSTMSSALPKHLRSHFPDP